MTEQRDVRQVLLDAAAAEFARYGLAGARMSAIVARAGINERMIYHHFGSKVGLYEAVLADHFRAPKEPPPVARSDDPMADFLARLSAFVRAMLRRSQFLPLVLHEALTGWEHVPKASLSDIPDVLRAAFERAQRAGAIRKDCRFEVVYLAAVGGAVSSHLLAGRFADLRTEKARDRLVADVLELVVRGAAK